MMHLVPVAIFFFFNDTATTEIYTLSLHDALPISSGAPGCGPCRRRRRRLSNRRSRSEEHTSELQSRVDLVCRLLLEKKKITAADTAAPKRCCHSRWLITTTRSQSLADEGGGVFAGVSVFLWEYFPACCFFFNDTATTEIYTLSLHDALPICARGRGAAAGRQPEWPGDGGDPGGR